MGRFFVSEHPLIHNKITMLRQTDTSGKEFRELVEEVAALMCYEATRDIPVVDVQVQTPICSATVKATEAKFAVIPVLRAGLGMVNGILRFLPTARVGHIGIYRDPDTLKPVEYYCKLPPDAHEREVFLVDPMLATGGTASEAIGFLKAKNVRAIKLICLLACPVGVERVHTEHQDVDIYAAACDPVLNSHGYIVPGLGDAGDRMFGTK